MLRSGVAMAVVWASGYSSHLTPNLETSICLGCGPKKDKNKKERQSSGYEQHQDTGDQEKNEKMEKTTCDFVEKAKGKSEVLGLRSPNLNFLCV